MVASPFPFQMNGWYSHRETQTLGEDEFSGCYGYRLV